MKKLILPLIVGCLSVSFTYSPPATDKPDNRPVGAPHTNDSTTISTKDNVATELYINLGLERSGLSVDAFAAAWKGYNRLIEKNLIVTARYLTICDLSQSSRQKRLYIIDIATNKLITNTYVAHGRNSGGEYATKFSNKPESLQSSLGFFITRETYNGKHGLSLRLQGVDGHYNDKAYERTIVIHGAEYVNEDRVRAGSYMGRSWGCPSLSKKESTGIINLIKGGSCLFIYYPDKKYLENSTILND